MDTSDVVVVTTPLGKLNNVAFYLMQYTQIKTKFLWPYWDGEHTYQIADMVMMGHFFEKKDKSRVVILFT